MFSLVIARAHLAPRSNAPQAPRTRRRRIVPRTSRAAASVSDFFRHDQRRRLFMSGSALETSASSTASSSRLPAMSALRGSTMVERMSQSGRLGPDTSTTQDTATCRRRSAKRDVNFHSITEPSCGFPPYFPRISPLRWRAIRENLSDMKLGHFKRQKTATRSHELQQAVHDNSWGLSDRVLLERMHGSDE